MLGGLNPLPLLFGCWSFAALYIYASTCVYLDMYLHLKRYMYTNFCILIYAYIHMHTIIYVFIYTSEHIYTSTKMMYPHVIMFKIMLVHAFLTYSRSLYLYPYIPVSGYTYIYIHMYVHMEIVRRSPQYLSPPYRYGRRCPRSCSRSVPAAMRTRHLVDARPHLDIEIRGPKGHINVRILDYS